MSNINENRINVTLSAADVTAMTASLNAFLAKIPANTSLSDDERSSYTSIDDENKVYCENVLNEGLTTGTGIIPTYVSLAHLQNDLTLHSQFKLLEAGVDNLAQRIADLLRIAGHESYKVSNVIYKSYKDAADDGVPNAKSAYDRLRVRFEGQGRNADQTA